VNAADSSLQRRPPVRRRVCLNGTHSTRVSERLGYRDLRPSPKAQKKQEVELCPLTHKSTRCLGLLGFPSDPVHKGPLCLEAEFHLLVKISQTDHYRNFLLGVKDVRSDSCRRSFLIAHFSGSVVDVVYPGRSCFLFPIRSTLTSSTLWRLSDCRARIASKVEDCSVM
jgi:hypothetical protein